MRSSYVETNRLARELGLKHLPPRDHFELSGGFCLFYTFELQTEVDRSFKRLFVRLRLSRINAHYSRSLTEAAQGQISQRNRAADAAGFDSNFVCAPRGPINLDETKWQHALRAGVHVAVLSFRVN